MWNRMLAIVAVGAVASATPVWAGADEGKALYDKQCKVCHSIGAERGKMAEKGGPLDDVGTKRDAAWLRQYLSDPKSAIPDAKMPKMKLDERQLEDLIAYMLTLKGTPPGK
jgi:nitric oxide reductase subunit C